MQLFSLLSLVLAASLAFCASIVQVTERTDIVNGVDISADQRNILWSAVSPDPRFVYVKATEGICEYLPCLVSHDVGSASWLPVYANPYFSGQYNGSPPGLHGAYHTARPEESNGIEQAKFFLEHGGLWSSDGIFQAIQFLHRLTLFDFNQVSPFLERSSFKVIAMV